jgi:hypothetical protein
VRTGYSGIADVGDENLTPTVIVGEAVGTDANVALDTRVGTGGKMATVFSARLE